MADLSKITLPNNVSYNLKDTTARNFIDNLEVGGKNLLGNTANSIAYTGASGKYTQTFGSIGYYNTVNLTLENYDEYSNSIIVTSAQTGNKGVSWYTKKGEIVAGQKYTFSCKIKPNVSISAHVHTAWRNGSATAEYVGWTLQGTTTIPANEWFDYSFTFTPNTSAKLDWEFHVAICFTGQTSGVTCRFAHAKLEKGTIATDWTPAPEDAEAGGRNYLKTNVDIGYDGSGSGFTWSVSNFSTIKINGTVSANISTGGNTIFGGVSLEPGIYTVWVTDKRMSFRIGKGSSSTHIFSDYTPHTRDNPYKLIVSEQDIYYLQPLAIATNSFSNEEIHFMLEKGNKASDWSPAPEDIKESIDTALDRSVEYINGTQTASTGAWTGKTTDASLYTGKTIAYRLPYAGSGNATLNLTLAGGGTTGAKEVYLNTTRMTTHFGAGAVIQMTYDGTRWRATAIPNSNTYDRVLHNTYVKAAAAITAGHIICGTNAGYKHIAASTAFDLSYPILYASAAVNSGAQFGSAYDLMPAINPATSGTVQGIAVDKIVYLKGTISGHTFTIAASNWLTCTVPTSVDNMFYIPLGVVANDATTKMYFAPSDKIFTYFDGSFQSADTATIELLSEVTNHGTLPLMPLNYVDYNAGTIAITTKSTYGAYKMADDAVITQSDLGISGTIISVILTGWSRLWANIVPYLNSTGSINFTSDISQSPQGVHIRVTYIPQ